MKRKITLSICLFLLLFQVRVYAIEGMWLPLFLKQMNEKEMQSMGFKLGAEDIFSNDKPSLKDAVVHFNNGCTAEMISAEGLILTNHHCGFSQIQSHSSLENDLLTKGFWAMSKKEELPNPGLVVSFIISMKDVSKEMMQGITDNTDENERKALLEKNAKAEIKKATEGTHYEAYIRPFYQGNEYYMFVVETFKDVRLVGAPPNGIGKFGSDADNWMWPRHTGDFSIFRIYADKDNKPAEYSQDNVPMKPRHFFPISLKGVKENDFTLLYGFPGRTTQYLPSYAVEYTMNKSNVARIKMRDLSLSIMDKDMRESDLVRIQYSAKYARISNAHKKWIGENRGLKRLDAITKKKEMEKLFQEKVNANENYKKLYGNLLNDYKKAYDDIENYSFARDYYIELMFFGPEIIRMANDFDALITQLENGSLDAEKEKAAIEKMLNKLSGYFKNYNTPTDKKLFEAMPELYFKEMDPQFLPEIFQTIQGKYKGDFKAYAHFVFTKSKFTNQAELTKILNGGKKNILALKKDPAYVFTKSLSTHFNEKIKPTYETIAQQITKIDRQYMEALRTVLPDYRKYYPDANSTMRVAYGKVEGYKPMDGVNYDYYTTLDGVIEKYDPTNYDFDVPKKLLELHKNKDYGPYAQNGKMHLCFVASNHSTGGNSGSPVLDAEGNLIGLNFDRCWEGTMSDIMFDPERCRNIMVDLRYVLFIVDKFAGAGHLVSEMKLVK